jgi:hypothetical protein
MALETIHGALHAQAWKLAQSGRDRDQPVQPPMPWKTPDRGHRYAAPSDQSLESTRESRSHHDLLEVHQKTGASENELLIYTVIVLAGINRSSIVRQHALSGLICKSDNVHILDILAHNRKTSLTYQLSSRFWHEHVMVDRPKLNISETSLSELLRRSGRKISGQVMKGNDFVQMREVGLRCFVPKVLTQVLEGRYWAPPVESIFAMGKY